MVLTSALQGTIKYFQSSRAINIFETLRAFAPCKAEIITLIYFWQLAVVFSLALVLLSSASEPINNPITPEKSIRVMIAIARQADILNFKSCIIKC